MTTTCSIWLGLIGYSLLAWHACAWQPPGMAAVLHGAGGTLLAAAPESTDILLLRCCAAACVRAHLAAWLPACVPACVLLNCRCLLDAPATSPHHCCMQLYACVVAIPPAPCR